MGSLWKMVGVGNFVGEMTNLYDEAKSIQQELNFSTAKN